MKQLFLVITTICLFISCSRENKNNKSFFSFLTKEPVPIVTPDYVVTPDYNENILMILIDEEEKIYISIENLNHRQKLIELVAEQQGISLTKNEMDSFKGLSVFGTPIEDLKEFLSLTPQEQDKALKGELSEIKAGIPCNNSDGIDEANNELKVWIKTARAIEGEDMKIVIKVSPETPYPTIRNLMTSLQDIRENRYNLITNLKTISDN